MQGGVTLTECLFHISCKGMLKVSCRRSALAANSSLDEFLQLALQVSVCFEQISNAKSRGFNQCGINRTAHNRSKVPVSPAFCHLGPRFPLPCQLGAQVA